MNMNEWMPVAVCGMQIWITTNTDPILQTDNTACGVSSCYNNSDTIPETQITKLCGVLRGHTDSDKIRLLSTLIAKPLPYNVFKNTRTTIALFGHKAFLWAVKTHCRVAILDKLSISDAFNVLYYATIDLDEEAVHLVLGNWAMFNLSESTVSEMIQSISELARNQTQRNFIWSAICRFVR
jgi:hypothetical protein